MSVPVRSSLQLVHYRLRLLLTGFALCATIYALTLSGPVSSAPAADAFCTNVWLQPYGQNGDRCYESTAQGNWHLADVVVFTQERAGCVTYAGYYGELYGSWQCAGAHSSKLVYVPNDGGFYRGVIRNNNLSYAASFTGQSLCCWPSE